MAKNNKWDSIEWLGTLIFPPEYERHGFKVSGMGPFDADVEERLYHFAGKIDTEYMSNALFIKNFHGSLLEVLPEKYAKLEFPKDFMPYLREVKSFIDAKKEEAKTKEAKDAKKHEKAQAEELKSLNGFIILNGDTQPLATFAIEPPGILITRGDDKRIGCWKYRVRPEDVTINATKGKGPTPPAGHHWKAVTENKGALWCAHYFVKFYGFKERLPKKVLLGATSVVTKDREQDKYEKARQLILKWDEIEAHIMKGLKSTDPKTKLTATVVYLVQQTGCRIGGEKDLDVVADTVGISTLRKEHVSLSGHTLTLEFLGKDSVLYKNTLPICKEAAEVIMERLKVADDKTEIFEGVTSVNASDFLRDVVPKASIKTFRTAYGTKLLCEELQKHDFSDPSMTVTQKLHIYDLCNLAVAKKLNHKKTPPKNFDEKTKVMEERLTTKEQAVGDLEKKLTEDLKALLKQVQIAKETFTGNHLKKTLEKYDEKKHKLTVRLDNAREQIEQRKTRLQFREETKEVAIGTSRSSYSSPRIAYSWCKDTGVSIDKVYSKSAIGKMAWAEDTERSYWRKFPSVKAN